VNLLDENIVDSQRQLLYRWRIRIPQIGHEVGRQGMTDEEIIPLLHRLGPATFFTRDLGFYDRRLGHARYCLVCLSLEQYEVASFIRRFLRHPAFNTQAKRMGTVIRVGHVGMQVWHLRAEQEEEMMWSG
jgi:hypothetical protein